MKHSIISSIFILSFSFLFSQPIQNPGFEDMDENGLVEGWKGSQEAYEFLADSTQSQSGNYSFKIKEIGEGRYGAFSQSFEFSVDKVKKYRFSGFIKLEEVTQFTGLWIRVMAGENMQFFNNMGNIGLKGTKDWAKYEIEFFADESATNIVLGGLMAGSGQVWFDDFSLEELPMKNTEPNETVNNYLNEVRDIMAKHALLKDSVDFDKMMEKARLMAADADSIKDTYNVIRYMLKSLGDNHSFFMQADQANSWANTSKSDKPVKIPQATGRNIGDNISYISMPGFGSGDPKTIVEFADSIQNLIKRLDQSKNQGWILDLRNNTGGNCWPMLAGIGPVLGEGLCGYFVNGDGSRFSWGYKKGSSRSGRHKITKVSDKPHKFKEKFVKVAVLTGKRTGSSGEVVTVSFRERPNTRSFGQPTAGLSTGNRQFNLSDGSKIFLTSSVYADRTGHSYGHKIVPDEVIEYSDEDINTDNDPVIKAAVEWLNSN